MSIAILDDALQAKGVSGDLFSARDCYAIPAHVVQAAIDRLPTALAHDHGERVQLLPALIYLERSLDLFAFLGDEFVDALERPEEVAQDRALQARVQDSFHNAFKAIEAVIGEPNRDDRRLRS